MGREGVVETVTSLDNTEVIKEEASQVLYVQPVPHKLLEDTVLSSAAILSGQQSEGTCVCTIEHPERSSDKEPVVSLSHWTQYETTE